VYFFVLLGSRSGFFVFSGGFCGYFMSLGWGISTRYYYSSNIYKSTI